jgi:hypothetical protein
MIIAFRLLQSIASIKVENEIITKQYPDGTVEQLPIDVY